MASVIETLIYEVRDCSDPTKIGFKIPENGQKLLKNGKQSLITPYLNFKKYNFIINNFPYWGRGHFFHVTLFHSKKGLRDQDFQDK